MERVEVAIIGTGFGGLAMAISLERAGIGPVILLEAKDGVGGTWRDNTYPGAACDVTSALYSFSFHPHVWTRKYPQQPEILDYIEEVVDVFGLRPKIRFGARVRSMTYDESAGRWTLDLDDGRQIDARVVVSSVGQLNQPAFPDVPGIERFSGEAFHSAEWNHSVDLSGKRVGIVGTGASVIQFAPRVAEIAESTTIFQRSAPYVLPKEDPLTPPWKRRLYGLVPQTQLPARFKNFFLNEVFGSSILGNTKLRAKVLGQWAMTMKSQVKDPELRAKCTPDYELGCKRVLIAPDWYSTLVRDDVSVETESIEQVIAEGVVTVDGTIHECDVLIYGTGFKATEFLTPIEVIGRSGLNLNERWSDGASAFRGVAVSGFPNLFLLYGPNTNLGSNSIVYMLETQATYITDLLLAAERAHAGSVEVRHGAENRWQDLINERSKKTAWVTGCHSWYTANGRNTNNWPDLAYKYRRLLKDVDLLDFDLRPVRSPEVAR